MLSRIKRKNNLNFQSAFCTQSAVCILYWLDWYCCFCLSEPQVRTEIMELERKFYTILAAMIDVLTACWRALEDKHNDRAMSTLYQLKTNANAPLANMAASDADALLRGHSVFWNEPATSPLGVNISAFRLKLHFKKFGNVIWCYHCFWTYKYFVSFHLSFWASSKLILTFTKWGGVACETLLSTVHGMQLLTGNSEHVRKQEHVTTPF